MHRLDLDHSFAEYFKLGALLRLLPRLVDSSRRL